MANKILLEVKNLKTHFALDEGTVKAVNGVDFGVKAGITLGIVGESGCGKSVTALSILQLVMKPGRIVDGQIIFRGSGFGDHEVDLLSLAQWSKEMQAIRGDAIAMIFQEPMNSLSPIHTIGDQIIEAIRLHRDFTKEQARQQSIELLQLVGIPDPARNVDAYTFELSGGMRQRAMIAMALACQPQLLIADEPTTALDVTTQAQIISLLQTLQEQFGMSVIIITHDLGVVAEMCDEVVVMYLGEVVEQADVDSLFYDPLHPYTRSLLESIPRLGLGKKQSLNPIQGAVPDPFSRPEGCAFHPRCRQRVTGVCDKIHPQLTQMPDGRRVRCVLYDSEVATS